MSSKFFKDLKGALDEAIAHKNGKIKLRSIEIEIPEPPAEYKPKDIKKIRAKNRYSQSSLAMVLNVSVRTVQSWESGQRVPSHAALRLLEIVDKGIYNPPIFKR